VTEVPNAVPYIIIVILVIINGTAVCSTAVRGVSRYGFRGRELLNTVGKAMIQGGGTFGTFMAIGTGIRC